MLLDEKLKLLRKSKNLTQEQMAEKLNVSRQAITKWETGEGTPDTQNLIQISKLFDISLDDLLKQEEEIKIDKKEQYSYIQELEIDHSKHFDINICEILELTIKNNTEEKVKLELLSDTNPNIMESLNIELDDLYNRLDINIIKNKSNNKDIIKNDIQDNDLKICIYLPQKYIDKIELNANVKTINIIDLELEDFEFDGKMKYLNVKNTKGNIVLNADKSDIEVFYDKFEGSLEVNIINSTARVQIPKDTEYRTIIKGIKNKFINENSNKAASNSIELNGINSKLILI